MKLSDIIQSWEVDSKIDDLNLDLEGAKISNLHSKYISILSSERMSLRGMHIRRKNLIRILREYYNGSITQEDLAEINRLPCAQRILRSDLMLYVESDSLLIELDTKISVQEEKVDVLSEIMKSINNRNFALKSMIEWKRLMLGG